MLRFNDLKLLFAGVRPEFNFCIITQGIKFHFLYRYVIFDRDPPFVNSLLKMFFYFVIQERQVILLFVEQGYACPERGKNGGVLKSADTGTDNNQPPRNVSKVENGFIIKDFVVLNFKNSRFGGTAARTSWACVIA